jgi:glycosyltransferase involved in cell wall biosynthesis
MKPLVSVILPVYNAANFLNEAIDSILEQTYTNLELIIINDGSTDISEEIIKAYTDHRIRYINNEINIGLNKSLNRALAIARGELIARMDADDISMPTRIEKQVQAFQQDSSLILVGSNAGKIDTIGNLDIIKNEYELTNEILKAILFFTCPFTHPTIMFRKFSSNGLVLYNENIKQAEDYCLYAFLVDKGRFTVINESLLLYREYESNTRITSERNRSDIFNGRIAAWKIILDYLKVDYPEDIIFSIHDKLTYYPHLLTVEEIRQLHVYFTFLSTLKNSNIELQIFDRAMFTRNISFRIYSTLSLRSISANQFKKIFLEFRNLLTTKEQFKLVVKWFKSLIESKIQLSY